MNRPDSAGPIRVVLADDNPVFRDGIRHLLSEHEWLQVVGAASHGAECIALVTEKQPDVVVVDLDMPDLNGFEVAKRIKCMPAHPPIIIVSLYNEPEYREGGENLGVYGYVAKDMVTTELVPLLQSLYQQYLEKLENTAR
jgi:DNA-binding NarL/FixJ family response regulator